MYTALLLDVAGGKEKAFERFHTAFHPRVITLCHKYLVPDADMPDVAQEIYGRIWHKWELLPGSKNPTAYVFKMVHNILRRFKSGATKTSQLIHTDSILTDRCTEQADFTHPAWFDRMQFRIEAAISKLSPQQQQVMVRSRNGMKRREIAIDLDMSIDAVSRNLQEGNKKLRSAALDYLNKL